MGKKDNTKAKEKKAEKKAAEKKAYEKKNEGVANVKLANSVEDPLANLPKPFSVYNKNGLDLTLETVRAPDMEEKDLAWAFNTVKTTMKPLYDEAYKNDPNMGFGWKEQAKQTKMRDDLAWYLMVRTKEGTAVAFSLFRFVMDSDEEVLYCYELQVGQAFRRKGLGRFMMKVLEMLMIKADMLKLKCTILKKDKPMVEFFGNALKFEMDETSFVAAVPEQFVILCRHNQIKKRRIEEANQETVLPKANAGKSQCGGCCG